MANLATVFLLETMQTTMHLLLIAIPNALPKSTNIMGPRNEPNFTAHLQPSNTWKILSRGTTHRSNQHLLLTGQSHQPHHQPDPGLGVGHLLSHIFRQTKLCNHFQAEVSKVFVAQQFDLSSHYLQHSLAARLRHTRRH